MKQSSIHASQVSVPCRCYTPLSLSSNDKAAFYAIKELKFQTTHRI
jgi:hypothetical protein